MSRYCVARDVQRMIPVHSLTHSPHLPTQVESVPVVKKGGDDGDDGLSAGAIVGIVVGALFGLSLAVGNPNTGPKPNPGPYPYPHPIPNPNQARASCS